MNTTFNIVSTENATFTELAQAQFLAEDKLEREFHAGFISEDEYNEGMMEIYFNLDNLIAEA